GARARSWRSPRRGAEPPGRGIPPDLAEWARHKHGWRFWLRGREPSMSEGVAFPDFIRRIRAGDDRAARELVERYRRGQAVRLWRGPAAGGVAHAASDRGGPGPRHAAVHGAGAGDERRPGGGRAERPLRARDGGL